MAKFPFTDLHSFKDYVGFVQTSLPNRFPVREWAGPDDQWTLDRAFEDLRYGLRQAVNEKGVIPTFAECRKLIDEAYTHYQEGRIREGFFKLEEVQKLLKKVPSK